ncbi:hypothetical protein VTJ04DRAFT_7759 [Mycothermus thermophilus]|uniref:uncharacterized protein n=1 Tax=Humicola insolens TaxID=85995 RepID=UPI003742A7A7
MFNPLPTPIQPPAFSPPSGTALDWDDRTPPVLLIHDGGGTTFSYYCLGDLGRLVYGIANPRYDSGKAWDGGIPEMAAHYLSMLKSGLFPSPPPSDDIGKRPIGMEKKKKKVILGGWSLGGMIALEMARQVATDPEQVLEVVGVVMVDSPCPFAPSFSTSPQPPPKVVQHVVEWSPMTREDTKRKITRCFSEALRMLGEWTLPEWADNAAARGVRPPPPVVLIRATEPVPVVEQPGVARVDVRRGDRTLGWEGYRKGLVMKVIDVPGHHYNMFQGEEHLDAVTEAIRQACTELDGMARVY